MIYIDYSYFRYSLYQLIKVLLPLIKSILSLILPRNTLKQMDILYLMILCSVSLALIFLIVFIINVKKGQFEDDESPAVRILFDDEAKQDENQEIKELNNEKKIK